MSLLNRWYNALILDLGYFDSLFPFSKRFIWNWIVLKLQTQMKLLIIDQPTISTKLTLLVVSDVVNTEKYSASIIFYYQCSASCNKHSTRKLLLLLSIFGQHIIMQLKYIHNTSSQQVYYQIYYQIQCKWELFSSTQDKWLKWREQLFTYSIRSFVIAGWTVTGAMQTVDRAPMLLIAATSTMTKEKINKFMLC